MESCSAAGPSTYPGHTLTPVGAVCGTGARASTLQREKAELNRGLQTYLAQTLLEARD